MITMPWCSLSRILQNWTGASSKAISPSDVPCGYTPERIFIRVDLPAPFSPQIAWISPGRTERETSFSARTPGKVLVIARISRTVSSEMVSSDMAARCLSYRDETFGSQSTRDLPGDDHRAGRVSQMASEAEVRGGVEAGLDERVLDVVGGDGDGVDQVGRDDLNAVVVGLGVVHVDLLAVDDLVDHRRDLRGKFPGVLPHGHGLLAGDDVDHVRLVAVLPGQHRVVRARAVAGAREGLGDAQREGVVRGEHDIQLRAGGVEGVEPVGHLVLGGLRGPSLDADARPVLVAGR